MVAYHYVECGLDNVYVEGIVVSIDIDGDEVITIPAINRLHKTIAAILVGKPSSLNGRELRFLRTEMGMTQAELATIVHREPLAISRWERGEVAGIDANAEAIIRLLARETLDLDVPATVKQIASYSVPGATSPRIDIDGSDPMNYRPMGVAA